MLPIVYTSERKRKDKGYLVHYVCLVVANSKKHLLFLYTFFNLGNCQIIAVFL